MRASAVCILLILLAGCVPTTEVDQESADAKTDATPDGWNAYVPSTPRSNEPRQKVEVEYVCILTPLAAMEIRTCAADVAAFLWEAERVANASFGNANGPFHVLVQFNCNSSGHRARVSHRGSVSREELQKYVEALAAARNLPVKEGEVSFLVEYSVRP